MVETRIRHCHKKRKKGAIMKKSIQTLLFAITVLAVLGAGTLSAKQLRSGAQQSSTCGGRCLSKLNCATGCVCSFTTPDMPGFCTTKLAGVVPSGK
jgi:hypothetical protein